MEVRSRPSCSCRGRADVRAGAKVSTGPCRMRPDIWAGTKVVPIGRTGPEARPVRIPVCSYCTSRSVSTTTCAASQAASPRRATRCSFPNLFSHGSRIVCLSRVMTDMVRGSVDREIADILAARAVLAEREDVDADRIAVAGFCLGGGFALIAATKPGFKAGAVNYGDVPKDRAKLDGVCPVVASFGSKDRMFGRNMAERLETHLSALGVEHDIQTYDGVGHSFFSQHEGWQGWLARMPTPMMVGPDADAASDGWRRMLSFFEEHVRSAAA